TSIIRSELNINISFIFTSNNKEFYVFTWTISYITIIPFIRVLFVITFVFLSGDFTVKNLNRSNRQQIIFHTFFKIPLRIFFTSFIGNEYFIQPAFKRSHDSIDGKETYIEFSF